MLTLGIAGGLDPVHRQLLDSPEHYTYDSAAVLLEDGQMVVAVEQERIDRIARSNKFPAQAIARCLQQRGIAISDVDHIAYYAEERLADQLIARLVARRPELGACPTARALFARTLGAMVGPIDPERLRFVDHRLTHAHCALAQSGQREVLVYVIDNVGGIFVGRVDNGQPAIDLVTSFPREKSLGRLCQAVFPALGLGRFDEHRALALASAGDPAPFSRAVQALYELLPNGDYVLRLERAGDLPASVADGAVADLAAALQRAQEEIVLHVLAHHRRGARQQTLAIAGGMAENPATNGRIVRAGLFDDVYISPVAGDSGCALGAALAAWYAAGGTATCARTTRVDWGPPLGEDREVEAAIARWHGLVSYERAPDPARQAAAWLAGGAVIGWLAGRSELGRHALGSRNVWVDPRTPAARVTAALHRREEGRALAAVILAEAAAELFELPAETSLPFQTVMVPARDRARATLGAVCGPDGGVRVQTVARDGSATRALLDHFHELTGVPVLATTSLNRDHEPVAESVDDAIVILLGTELDYLVVAGFVVRKASAVCNRLLDLALGLPPYVTLVATRGLVERQRGPAHHELHTTYDDGPRRRLSVELGERLMGVAVPVPVGELIGRGSEREAELLAEINALWHERLVALQPIAKDSLS